jgi:adenine-specific DNA-methyltransferase
MPDQEFALESTPVVLAKKKRGRPKTGQKKSVDVAPATAPELELSSEQSVNYLHLAKRLNNPPAGLAAEGRAAEPEHKCYAYNPHRPPTLRFDGTGKADRAAELAVLATQRVLSASEVEELKAMLSVHEPWIEWAGKREAQGFEVDPVALHIHERVSTQAILRAVQRQDLPRGLFADPALDPAKELQFYRYRVDWANRMVLGDSLQVMASLARRENLAGQVQMIYIDPPYGIKFGSNFQAEVGKRDVKDKDSDLTREPEMVRAYRDTWTLGVHSYLAYLRDRLIIARELLTDSGSVFVQIGFENIHRVQNVMDEVFGSENYVVTVVAQKKGSQKGELIQPINDFILWYAKKKFDDIGKLNVKFNPIFQEKSEMEDDGYDWLEFNTGEEQRLSGDDESQCEAKLFVANPLTSGGVRKNQSLPFEFRGRIFDPGDGNCWKTTVAKTMQGQLPGMSRLAESERLWVGKNQLRFKSYISDFGLKRLTNFWTGVGGAKNPIYVVQTNSRLVERCLLMTSDPGDLVLDPTCGSGTTASVAEQWGRRWITCDTSRVALSLARQRLMTAKFDY